MQHIHVMEYYSYEMEWASDICYNMDGPWKHAKWNKPDMEGWILYDFMYMKYLE